MKKFDPKSFPALAISCLIMAVRNQKVGSMDPDAVQSSKEFSWLVQSREFRDLMEPSSEHETDPAFIKWLAEYFPDSKTDRGESPYLWGTSDWYENKPLKQIEIMLLGE
tara:strand:- start:197 stop:523 length:327 start_codon:yes stop_codon:yes gene_type:complete